MAQVSVDDSADWLIAGDTPPSVSRAEAAAASAVEAPPHSEPKPSVLEPPAADEPVGEATSSSASSLPNEIYRAAASASTDPVILTALAQMRFRSGLRATVDPKPAADLQSSPDTRALPEVQLDVKSPRERDRARTHTCERTNSLVSEQL